MLSRRDRLLVQPWEDRRFKDHRFKVASALPAIDSRAPPPRPHVAIKLKKWQREHERAARVASDNFRMLQRLGAIMRVNRLDNHWQKPLPNFQHKVGRLVEAGELAARLEGRRGPTEGADLPRTNVKCYACETKKMQHRERRAPTARGRPLPSIH